MRAVWLLLVTACWQNTAATTTAEPQSRAIAVPGRPIQIAHTVRGPGEAPSIEMPLALAAAKRYAFEHGVHFDTQYLQGAVFDAASRQWVFDWQTPNAKGGLTIVTVHESGQITINYGD